ncbi:bifunctional DNA-formamidopyrimidine glycosylase/DNA-(apurinic or apyrimidinic site) lyase [Pseudaeromonas paramecii]|uniref:Formamidopyrimidine-DNA glycosylase n=1 Tax=Pseudaeromonas paramecii TaxID=2138166 RepID=A0ABP8PXZ6_9GAMM
MPELPEVEVTRQGIAPHLAGQTITAVRVRESRLRWPVPSDIQQLVGCTILSVRRRAKYLLLETELGTAILHLGMSGNLRVLPLGAPVMKHDHVDIELGSGQLLRLHDPRRFGALLWTPEDPARHPLLAKLGPEPLTDAFTAEYLLMRSRGRKGPIKPWLMDNHLVVGVGNIYANEALFAAHIDPRRPAGSLSASEAEVLVAEIKAVLTRAIGQGGTTLKDFTKADGKPGYFAQQLQVYGRAGQGCLACGHPLEEIRLGQRSTVFCPLCQR